MEARTYLALDLGASSGRGLLGRVLPDGGIELQELHRFTNGPVPTDKGVYWDIDALFDNMLQAMRRAADMGIVPRAIGVDTWGVDFALLGKDGKLLDRPRCYRDPRNAGLSRRISQRLGAQRLQARTGSMLQDHASLCQLVAVQQHTPELLERTDRLVFICDLLRYWLCGDASTDCTFASTSQMYDVPQREWATDILRELNLPEAILPQVHIGPRVAGRLSPDVQRKTHLPDVPVVAGAGHDTGAAFGICRGGGLPPAEDLAIVSTGTWAILGAMLNGRLAPGAFDPARFGYEANPDGSLRLIRNMIGGWFIEQCRREWEAQGVKYTYDVLIAAAQSAAGSRGASAVLDIGWEGFMNPESMTRAIGEHCRITGQPEPRNFGETTQVIFASLAKAYADGVAELRRITGWPLRNLYVIGGMARNTYLNSLIEQTGGPRVIVGPSEATAQGNVAVQVAAVP